jgi:hypothetical protein
MMMKDLRGARHPAIRICRSLCSTVLLLSVVTVNLPSHASEKPAEQPPQSVPASRRSLELIADPPVVRQVQGKYPESTTLVLRTKDCFKKKSASFETDDVNYEIRVGGPGFSTSGITASGCTLQTTLYIDSTEASAGLYNVYVNKTSEKSVNTTSENFGYAKIELIAARATEEPAKSGGYKFIPSESAEDAVQAADALKAATLPPIATPAPGGAIGQQVMGSADSTPSACVTNPNAPNKGNALTNPALVGVRRELLVPKEASDIYGRRLGKRYIVYQVRISDYSKDFQYIVHDISLNLGPILWQHNKALKEACVGKDPDKYKWCSYLDILASSRDLDVLRGVPEKGQDLDPRNLTLHILTGIGAVAGGVNGLTPFSDVMGSAVAVFNGAFLQAFVGIAPDHTGTQLNRLSDQAFASNTVVDKLHTKVFAIFIPQALVFQNDEQKSFWKEPRTLLDTVQLDRVNVCVDGSLVTNVQTTPDPSFPYSNNGADINVGVGASIAILDSDPGAAKYYTDTENGTVPSTSSTQYSAPIPLTGVLGKLITHTVEAIAQSPNEQPSHVVTQRYVVQRMPVASPMPMGVDLDASSPVVTLKPADTSDTILYTTNSVASITCKAHPDSVLDPGVTSVAAGQTVPVTLSPGQPTTVTAVECTANEISDGSKAGAAVHASAPIGIFKYTVKAAASK